MDETFSPIYSEEEADLNRAILESLMVPPPVMTARPSPLPSPLPLPVIREPPSPVSPGSGPTTPVLPGFTAFGYRPPLPVPIPTVPMVTPTTDEEDVEDAMIQEAIRLSLESAEHARAAEHYATSPRKFTSPFNSPEEWSPLPQREETYMPPLSPIRQIRTEPETLVPSPYPEIATPEIPTPLVDDFATLEEIDRQIRMEQDIEYERALAIDREREDAAAMAAHEARISAELAEQAVKIMEQTRVTDTAMKNALRPPLLKYSLESSEDRDMYSVRFRLPNGSSVTHSFHRLEPLSSMIQQARFDARNLGQPRFLIGVGQEIMCEENTPLGECGVTNRSTLNVTFEE